MHSQQTTSDPTPISSASLRAQRAYTCANHPNKEAFCLCAKCGKMLCENCSFWISGRRYCEHCIEQDDALIEAMRKEFFKPAENKTRDIPEAPHRLSELPGAVASMFTNTTAFFLTAKDASFALSFLLAFCAVVPVSIAQMLYQYEELVSHSQYRELLMDLPVATRVATGIGYGALKILVLDLILWACIRVFTSSKMTFAQTGAMLHFCLVPLVLGVFGICFDLSFVGFLGLALMIIFTGTGIRTSSNCGMLQELGTLLSFVILSTLGGLLR